MRVFCDLHHADLYYSLHLLFEKRLGWELYRPLGIEWYNEGYFKVPDVYENPLSVAEQYLTLGGKPPTRETLPLNDQFRFPDGGVQRTVFWEEFQDTKFDIILASYLQHIGPFEELRKKYQPQAKLICQIGNKWSNVINWSVVKNLLASTAPFPVPDGVNAVFYHQEFDLDVFKYGDPDLAEDVITSFVQVLHGDDLEWFLAYEKALPEYRFYAHGAGSRDGHVHGHENLVRQMHRSKFVFHSKAGGDGFGHILHNTFAVGRPPIVRKSQYVDQLAGGLMIDGDTCLDIEGRSLDENVERIRFYADPNRYRSLCLRAYRRFKEVVDFDQEFEQIKVFLGNLI